MLKRLLVVAIGMMVLVLIECKKDDTPEPSLKDKQLQMLTGTWVATQITKDAVMQSDYSNFKITIAGTAGSDTFGYTCTGRPSSSPWPSSGTFTFQELHPENSLTRQDQITVLYAIDGNALELTLNYNGEGFPGRVNDIPGMWVFKFNKN